MVFYTDEIEHVLDKQYQSEEKSLLFLLQGLNTDSDRFSKPAEFKVPFSLLYLENYTGCQICYCGYIRFVFTLWLNH